MNLEELKKIIDHTIENLIRYDKPNEIPVLITLSESSIGPRASSEIKQAGLGFDWESGEFRIQPSQALVNKGNKLTDPKSVECRSYEGRNYYFCPKCEQQINKNDIYCRYCSQKLK